MIGGGRRRQDLDRDFPIVFAIVSDPVSTGFVASLANPGGNITGFINIEGSLSGPGAATSSRAVFDPTSMTPTLIPTHRRSAIGGRINVQVTVR